MATACVNCETEALVEMESSSVVCAVVIAATRLLLTADSALTDARAAMSATSPSGNTHAANSARGDGLASFGSKSSKRLSFERSEGVAGRQGSLSLL